MDFDNNQFEVKPNSKAKRKIVTPCTTAYLNPALDLLANEDPMCNTAMEIVPNKKRKRTKSCEIAVFENSALDVGVSKAAVNEFLVRELQNVRKNVKTFDSSLPLDTKENVSIYANLSDMSILSKTKNAVDMKETNIQNITPENMNRQDMYIEHEEEKADYLQHSQNNDDIDHNITENARNITDMSILQTDTVNPQDNVFRPELSEIEMDSGISGLEPKSNIDITDPNLSIINTTNIQTNITNQLFINNSNLNLSFIDRLALDSPNLSNQSLYYDDDLNESNIMEIKTITIITKKKRIEKKKPTNPFLDPYLDTDCVDTTKNPFLDDTKEVYNDKVDKPKEQTNLMPRRLFECTNSTISTVNESYNDCHEYENIDSYRAESPIYENISGELNDTAYNKQSKILGHDVSQFSAIDIMNLNRNKANSSNESTENKKDLKQLLKAGLGKSKKVFKTIKRTFKSEKPDNNTTLNPYEVPRKPPKQKTVVKESGIENPCLNLDNSDEIEIEEIDDDDDFEHQYETIKTIRNTRLNMNVTPLKERVPDDPNKTYTPGKKVRFDSTLNQEKIITGNSFDYGLQSPGFNAKIDKYHDELENCINERKFLEQNME